MEKGYLQVYTGEGKGKTTAALGLALRAVGSGFKVVIFQFLKGAPSGELISVKAFGENFRIVRLAETAKFFGALDQKEKTALREKLHSELNLIFEVLRNKSCDLLILDEIMKAIHGNLLTIDEVLSIIDARPRGMEMVLTGRNAPEAIIEKADLVTEMRNIKHYMDQGVSARVGIEK